MPISALPTPPSRSYAPQDFSDRADALLGALPGFVTEANALQSDVNAKEASASSYATIATDKAAEAQASATTASTKASEAAASAVAAAASASNAEIAFDSFDDKYLGSKASDPATDNDGNALLVGALYWNTTVGAVRVWNGSAWLSMAADASIVDFQQAGAGAVVRTAQDKMREIVSPEDFGAVGDGVQDDSTAMEAMWASGLPFYVPGKAYRITRTLAPVVPAASNGHYENATIVLDRASSVRFAIDFTKSAAFTVHWSGKVTLDAGRKAFTGWHFRNDDPTNLSDFYANGLSVKNVYRASQAFQGGDGIMIRGSFLNVTLENPWVLDCWMADGAIIPTSEGVFGITIRGSALAMPQPVPGKYTIINPYVRNILSESATETRDQDGIRVLDVGSSGTGFPYVTKFEVVGGVIANCRNRAIKSQLRYGVITGTQFLREGAVIGNVANVGGFGDEINFQNGGGEVIGCEFHYDNARPRSLVSFNGRVEVGEKNRGGGSIIGGGLNIFNNPGTLESLFRAGMRESKFMKITVTGFHVEGSNNISSCVTVESPTDITAKEVHVHLNSVCAPITSGGTNAFVTRIGGVETYVSGQNLVRNLESVVGGSASSASLWYSDTAGAVTKSLYGVNKRVADS